MKRILKLICVLSAICILASAFSTVGFATETSGTYGEGIEWTLSSNGTLTFSGAGVMADREFSESAPWGNSIKSVVVGEGIESIGKYAFANQAELFSVTIPASVKVIDMGAFYKCSKLKTVVLPDGLQVLGGYAFALCTSLEKINIPVGIKEVSGYTFGQCSALRSIDIPDSVTAIRKSSFFKCSDLKTVSFGKGVEIIEQSAFLGCGIETLSFGEKLTIIEKLAFEQCHSLYEVELPVSLKEVGDSAFYDCFMLKTVFVPESVEAIGYYAFGFNHVNGQGIRPVENFKMEVVKDSVAHTYAKENRISVEFVENKPMFPDSESNEYIDLDYNLMPNVPEKTTASTLISNLSEYGIEASIFDCNGNQLPADASVGTGCVVSLPDGSEFTVIVCGDVDGSGEIDSTDYIKIKYVFLGEAELEDIYLEAANADRNEEINSTDYLRIKGYFLGELDLYE